MSEVREKLSGIIYRELNLLYQKDGYTIPCKDRETVKHNILNAIMPEIPDHRQQLEALYARLDDRKPDAYCTDDMYKYGTVNGLNIAMEEIAKLNNNE